MNSKYQRDRMPIQLASQKISTYQQTWPAGGLRHASWQQGEEDAMWQLFTEFANQSQAWFARSNLPGHFTASALVTNRTMDKVLLTHHRKLNMWLQLGGHADGNPLLHDVAKQEVLEESGIDGATFADTAVAFGINDLDFPLPFDLDRHTIPARAQDPEHYHYDVRYLMICAETPPTISEESHDVRWLSLAEARALTQERSMQRQFDKLEALRKKISP